MTGTDTPFSTFAFNATRGSAPRTMPARLADIANVLDYNGATTDVKVQAAIDAALVTNGDGTVHWGKIYIPPGDFTFSNPVLVYPSGGVECGIDIYGAGPKSTKISAGFSNPLFSFGRSVTLSGDPVGSTTAIRALISGLELNNSSTNGASGCITIKGSSNSRVSNCKISNAGGIGLRCYDETYSTLIDNVQFVGQELTDASPPLGGGTLDAVTTYANGSVGCHVGQHTVLMNCDWSAYAYGLKAYSVEVMILNSRCEVNFIAFNLGTNSLGASSALSGFTIDGGSFESNVQGIIISAASYGRIANINIHGTSDGNRQMQEGIHIYGGGGITFDNVVVSATHDVRRSIGYSVSDWSFSGVSDDIYLKNCTGAGAEATANFVMGGNERFIRPQGGAQPTVRGAVTQGSSKSTGVTLDNRRGAITMHAATLNANTAVQFTLTNSYIAANDVVIASIKSGATASAYVVTVDGVAAGSCTISLKNVSAGNLGEALVINYAVIKDCI